MRFLTIAILALFTGGCVTADPMFDREGNPIWAISCPGTIRTMSDCFALAAKVCGPSGYRLLSAEQVLGPTNATATISVANGSGFGNYSQTQGVERIAYVACQDEIAASAP